MEMTFLISVLLGIFENGHQVNWHQSSTTFSIEIGKTSFEDIVDIILSQDINSLRQKIEDRYDILPISHSVIKL